MYAKPRIETTQKPPTAKRIAVQIRPELASAAGTMLLASALLADVISRGSGRMAGPVAAVVATVVGIFVGDRKIQRYPAEMLVDTKTPKAQSKEGKRTAAEVRTLAKNAYLALHSRDVTGTRVDHILIGPPGLFVVNVAAGAGRCLVADSVHLVGETGPLDAVVAAARRSADAMRLALMAELAHSRANLLPIVVVPSLAGDSTVVGGVQVVAAGKLGAFLRTRRMEALDREEAAQLHVRAAQEFPAL